VNPEALLVTTDEVLQLHSEIMTQHRQPYSPRADEAGCIGSKIYTSTVAASARSATGQIDPLHFASYLLYYIAKGHCFTDGNKRIAWAIAVDVLLRVGLDVEANDDDAVSMVNNLIAQEQPASFVIDWFAAPGRLKPYRI
jgi:death on curing protein